MIDERILKEVVIDYLTGEAIEAYSKEPDTHKEEYVIFGTVSKNYNYGGGFHIETGYDETTLFFNCYSKSEVESERFSERVARLLRKLNAKESRIVGCETYSMAEIPDSPRWGQTFLARIVNY